MTVKPRKQRSPAIKKRHHKARQMRIARRRRQVSRGR